MKRSFFGRMLLAAALAFASVTVFMDRVADTVASGWRMLKTFTLDAVAMVGAGSSDLNPVSIRIKQAKAFKGRMEKRERPVLTSTWRMCPSI